MRVGAVVSSGQVFPRTGETFEQWLARYIEIEALHTFRSRRGELAREARERQRKAMQAFERERDFAARKATIPNSVFALGGMGDVSPMVTGCGQAEG